MCGTARSAGSFSASGPEAELLSLPPVGYFLSLCLFLFFLLLFLVLAIALVAITVLIALVTVRLGVFEDFHRLAFLRFERLPLGFLKPALFAVVFPGVEDQMQLRQHLFDRRKLTGRSWFATRALFTWRPSPGFPCGPGSPRLPCGPAFPGGPTLLRAPSGWPCGPARPGSPCLPRGPGGPGGPWRPRRLVESSATCTLPMILILLTRRSTMAAIAPAASNQLININRHRSRSWHRTTAGGDA